MEIDEIIKLGDSRGYSDRKYWRNIFKEFTWGYTCSRCGAKSFVGLLKKEPYLCTDCMILYIEKLKNKIEELKN